MRSDESWDEGLGGPRYFLEYFEAVGKMAVVCLVYLIFTITIFHFTDGDGLVGAVYQQVDLSAVFQVFVCILIFHYLWRWSIRP